MLETCVKNLEEECNVGYLSFESKNSVLARQYTSPKL